MKDRPILFSAPMVRALLNDSKTQTRRVVKGNPPDGWAPEVGIYSPTMISTQGEAYPGDNTFGASDEEFGAKCPYGQPGDRLWVREAYSQHPQYAQLAYRADGNELIDADGWLWQPKFKPSIHMPRRASRLTLGIHAVRVERLHEISEADAIAEGIERVADFFGSPAFKDYLGGKIGLSPARSFQSLWMLINGEASWYANPWVWVVGFKRVVEGGAN